MKINRILTLVIVLMFSSAALTGCWNYREIEELAIAAGAALDINEDGTINITIEVINISGGTEVVYEQVFVESRGKTVFDASRAAITKIGKRIYWSHAKVIIISQDIAKKDIAAYMDFLFRDAEAREDTWLLISQEKTAKEILKSKGFLVPLASFEIDDTMRSQEAISRFPFVEMYEFFDRLFYKQVAPILPLVHLVEQDGNKISQVEGTAIFKNEKMIGTLDSQQTKDMLWLRDEVKGGLFIVEDVAGTGEDVTLEIYDSKSKITPVLEDEVLKMKVEIDLEVSIGEIAGTTDFINNPGQLKLIKAANEQMEKRVKATYLMVRDLYNADVFGFGRQVEMKYPKAWSQIKDKWDEYFAELDIDVTSEIEIQSTATTRMPVKVGE